MLDDVRYEHVQDIDDISDFTRAEIEHFFVHYKDLEPGKEVHGSGWAGKDEADKILAEAIERGKH